MKDHTLIAIDVAKTKLQVGKRNTRGKVICNQPMSRSKLKSWLCQQPLCRVAIESCAGSNYWGRYAQSLGHEVVMLAPKQVKPYRTGHKTDSNDVLAIMAASESVTLKPSRLLSAQDQGLQSMEKIRSLLDRHKTQVSNQIRGLLLEFGIVIPKGCASMRGRIMEILEDRNNGLPRVLRLSLYDLWAYHSQVSGQLREQDKRLCEQVSQDGMCVELMQLEGVGPIGAVKLKMQLSQDHYGSGRQAAASIGVTPRQHSSGGKVKMGGISKQIGDTSVRSTLFLGARSVVCHLRRREAKTTKERWLKALTERRGVKCAAIALVNKNIRTAYALVKHHTRYQVTWLGN